MTTKGIGWLIIGVLICISATEETVFLSAVSTVVIGLFFIAVYLLKQKYYPLGIGWFIFGGLLLSYCIEARVRNETLYNTVVAFAAALICFGIFWFRNREIAEMIAEDLDETADPLCTDQDDDHPDGSECGDIPEDEEEAEPLDVEFRTAEDD